MVASARVAYLARRAADYGVQTGPITIDMTDRPPAQARHRRELSRRQRTADQRRTDGVDLLIDGEASFIGPDRDRRASTDGETRES